MQQAEENMGKKWGVPKIGAWIPDDGKYADLMLRSEAWAAIQCARRQWAQGVRPEVELAEEIEVGSGLKELELLLNSLHLLNSRATSQLAKLAKWMTVRQHRIAA